MKFCNKCGQFKDESQFSIKNSKTGKRQSICQICHRKYSKKHYNKNKQQYIQKSVKRNKILIQQNKQLINQIKIESGCKICGENCLACLDFHHLNEKDKLLNIAWSLKYSQKTLLKEISKCIVLCSNCHRKLHAGLIQVAEMGLEPILTTF